VAQPTAIPSSFSALSDTALATMVAGGDEHAFEVLYRRHRDGLFRFCRSITGNPEDAEEAFQAAMLNAYRALRGGARAAPVRPWLFRIAHNASVSLLRMRRAGPVSGDLESASDPLAGIHERVEHRERLRALIDDFGRLPVRQRAALAMREIEGLSHAAVAQALDTTPLDARHLVHSARCALSEQDAGRGETCGRIRGLVAAGDRRVLRGRRIASHLRACEGCRVFAVADRDRRAGLAVVFPLLPIAAGERILDGILGRAAGSVRIGPFGAAGAARLAGGRFARVIGASLGAGATATVVGISALLLGVWSNQGFSADMARGETHRPPPAHVSGGSPISSLARESGAEVAVPPPDPAPVRATYRPIVEVSSSTSRPAPPRSVTLERAEVGIVEIVSVDGVPDGAPNPPPITGQPLQVAAVAPAPAAGTEVSAPAPSAEPPIGPTAVAPAPVAPIVSVVAPPPAIGAPDSKGPPRPSPVSPKGAPAPDPKTPRVPKGARPIGTPVVVPLTTSKGAAVRLTDVGARAVAEASSVATDPAIAEEPAAPAAEIPPAAVVTEPSTLEPPTNPDAPPATVVEVVPALPAVELTPPATVVETAVADSQV
jgi:RNA polymerase sigma factor (sigma-70 family)